MFTLCHILYIRGNAETCSGFEHLCHNGVGRDSSISIVTRYGTGWSEDRVPLG